MDPLALADLARIQREGTFRGAFIDPDELIPVLLARRLFENTLELRRIVKPDFFSQFSARSCVILLPRIHVTGARTDPLARCGIFRQGASLQKKLPRSVEDKHVNSAVKQFFPMNDGAGFLPEHLIIPIDDIKHFAVGD
jgi:hypothetical protein